MANELTNYVIEYIVRFQLNKLGNTIDGTEANNNVKNN